jgi:hypothetical protein
MAAYRATVDKMAQSFIGYEVHHIKQADNDVADMARELDSTRDLYKYRRKILLTKIDF